ncbi:MAG: polysaccharide deacetylase family protein, partial [Candidatus Latescibacteria bacterium]|nr:polysaccharide deacetylase family protein [Candidatus Latescibacterota bacterium]
FKQQLAYLRKRRYNLQSAGQAVDAYSENQITHKCVVLTFDDAYTTTTSSIEELLTHQQTATIFVATSVIGKSNLWDIDLKHIDQIEIMHSDHLRALNEKGCELGAHTHSHPKLTEIHPEDLKDELCEGRTQIEQHFGKKTDIIAYPYGDHNDRVKDATSGAGYAAGFTTQLGYLTPQSEVLAIPRFPTHIDLQLFRLIVHGGYGWYRKIQDRLFG